MAVSSSVGRSPTLLCRRVSIRFVDPRAPEGTTTPPTTHIADNATTSIIATPTPPSPHQQANVVDNSSTTESTRARVVCIYNISDGTSAYRTHTFLTQPQSVWRWRSCITDSGTPDHHSTYIQKPREHHIHTNIRTQRHTINNIIIRLLHILFGARIPI